MQLKVFSIRDAKAEIFNAPFYKRSHGEAERDFSQLTTDGKSTVNQYPEDFDLYYLGTYNDQTGKFDPIDSPQHVVKAAVLKDRLLNEGKM